MKIHRNLGNNKLKLGLAGKRDSIMNLKDGELLAFTNIAPQQDFILTNDFKEKEFKLNDDIDTRDSLPSIQKDSKDKLKKRSYSTMIKPFAVLNTKIPSLQISSSLKQNSFSPFLQSPKSFECDDKIQEIASLLRKNFIINSSNKLYYSIRKDHLINLLQQAVSSSSLMAKQGKSPSFPFLTDIFTVLNMEMEKEERRMKISRFRESKNINCIIYAGEDYQRECATIESLLIELNEKVKSSQNQLSQLQICIETLNKQKINCMQEITQFSRQEYAIRCSIDKQTAVLEQLNLQIATQQLSLKKFTDISHTYHNFVNVQQNNKLVAMASEKYKEIQSDIYDYASYLQCNQLASSLSYEPLQIQCITADIDSKLREINKVIIQKEQLTVKEKEILMRDFLLDAIDKFKKRDQEQKGFIAFKTKCIRTFIANMKKWLENWTLKQEYLTNLRNQFAAVSTNLVTLIQSTSRITSDNLNEHQHSLLQLFFHLQENYKMGNSFY